MSEKKQLEAVQTTHVGDKVLRRKRKPKGICRNISQNFVRLLHRLSDR